MVRVQVARPASLLDTSPPRATFLHMGLLAGGGLWYNAGVENVGAIGLDGEIGWVEIASAGRRHLLKPGKPITANEPLALAA